MLIQSDDFGQAYQEGFAQAIKGTDIKVVKIEKYQPGANEVGAQLTSLAATNADAFFNGGTLLACPDALKKAQAANWKPITWVSGTCISKTLMGIAGDAANNVLSMTNIMDPFNPQFANNPEMKLYKEKVKQYEPDADIDNGIVAYGWTQGAAPGEGARVGQESHSPRCDGRGSSHGQGHGWPAIERFSVTTSPPNDLFMGETVQVVQYDAAKKYFNDIGKPIDYEAKTDTLSPKDLISG